jgi:hypothetical protein
MAGPANLNKLAIPEIGCDPDKLQWGRVKEIISNEFIDISIDITVCRLKIKRWDVARRRQGHHLTPYSRFGPFGPRSGRS